MPRDMSREATPPGFVVTPPDRRAPTSSMVSDSTGPSRPLSPSNTQDNDRQALLSPNSARTLSLRSEHSSSHLPHLPVTQVATQEEDTAIDEALALKHKRRYYFRSHTSTSERSDDFDIEAVRHEIDAEHAACVLSYRHVELVADGQVVHSEAELPPEEERKKALYVWEIMYENQRGLSLWGKTWYSSNSLLPSDPSPFTVPIEPVGGDLLKRSGRDALNGREGREEVTFVPKFKRKSINSGYSLDTYQTPSPAWVWLTPWMVKMRTNTDEQGWRYNLWFHKKGWRSHPGHLNWWGWVRRRAWVRLRGLLPEPVDDEPEDVKPTNNEHPENFDDIVRSKRPVLCIIQQLAALALDREKQELWQQWVDHSSEDAMGKVRDLLSDRANLGIISRAFVFLPSRTTFLASLEKHNLINEQQCRDCSLIVVEGAKE